MSGPRALLFDAGNTRLKWGYHDGNAITKSGSITHEKLADGGYAALTTRLPTAVDTTLVANVAGHSFATRLAGVIGLHCASDVHFAHTSREAHGVTNSYRQPRRLGVDRWVAMIGAYQRYRKAVCVVDAGTAVTIDAVDSNGQHLGGQILPGVSLMMSALHEDTSDLPSVKRTPKAAAEALPGFAASTAGAIGNGALAAVCGAVERAMSGLKRASYRPVLVLTGGDASRILAVLDAKAEHRPNLVLEGLAIMAQDLT